MKYYTKKNKWNKRIIVLIIIIIILLTFFIYIFNKIILGTLMVVSDTEMRAKTIESIDENVLTLYSKEFQYDDVIKIEKDKEGNITMLRADTIKLNALSTKVSLEVQQDINRIGSLGIKFPIGYITRNNIVSSWGPKVTVRMEPIGSVKTNYYSEFESAGINQTRHKIYLVVEAKVNVIVPTRSDEVEVKSTIPIAETIIVGKTPQTNLDFGK